MALNNNGIGRRGLRLIIRRHHVICPLAFWELLNWHSFSAISLVEGKLSKWQLLMLVTIIPNLVIFIALWSISLVVVLLYIKQLTMTEIVSSYTPLSSYWRISYRVTPRHERLSVIVVWVIDSVNILCLLCWWKWVLRYASHVAYLHVLTPCAGHKTRF